MRSFLHKNGFRFRLHTSLPGRPDIVLPKYKTVIFVHGCFWHRHQGCKFCTTPSTQQDKWLEKFKLNEMRDAAAQLALKQLGWKVIVVWECELNGKSQYFDIAKLPGKIVNCEL
jgi:DNA mismatch endonuclease, patch repair protein